MFKIILSPTVSGVNDTPPIITGSTINYRGVNYDLSQLTVGAEVEANEPFIGKIKNNNSVIELTLQYQYSTETAEPMQSTDWNDYTFEIESGTCECPIKRRAK